ncbi:MAG: GNAT family N-acetyltransferase [Parcubacteria group bacterium]|nr:GNAT family N-acetyltransferase [Parcubacteria group bacterium]
MDIKQKIINATGIKFFIENNGREVARAYLYILNNSHERPFGFMEDVFVEENYRSQGWGGKLITELIKTAQQNNCYKLVGTSRYGRPKVHNWYLNFGFKDWGKEFRMDFDS